MLRSAFLVFVALVLSCTAATAQDVTLSLAMHENRSIMIVTNRSKLPVTAFVIGVDIPGPRRAWTRIYYDSYVNWRRDIPIPPGASAELPWPHASGAAPSPAPSLQAVLFSEGTSLGEERYVNDLLRRRQTLLGGLQRVAGLLRDFQSQDVGRQEALSALNRERSLRAVQNMHLPFEERIVGDIPFLFVFENLNKRMQIDRRMPEARVAFQHLAGLVENWRKHIQSSRPALSVDAEAFRIPTRQGATLLVMPASLRLTGPIAPFPLLGHPGPDCSASDETTVAWGPGTCGDVVFDLKAKVGETLHDVPFDAVTYGTCTGGFTHCQGYFVPQSREVGLALFFPEPNPPSGQTGFYWVLVNHNAGYFECECTDPYPQGTYEVVVDWFYPTPVYYVYCS